MPSISTDIYLISDPACGNFHIWPRCLNGVGAYLTNHYIELLLVTHWLTANEPIIPRFAGWVGSLANIMVFSETPGNPYPPAFNPACPSDDPKGSAGHGHCPT